jgi:phosphatidylinositol alpha-1,6-mannosyltransferase
MSDAALPPCLYDMTGNLKKTDFLFIASDYKPLTGGIAEYVDNLARGLKENGNRIRVLAVVQPQEVERRRFLENYEEWVDPFTMVHDGRPKRILGNKFISLLEIVRSLWPKAGHFLERTRFFRPSFEAILKLNDIISQDRPGTIIFGHLDRKLYPIALSLMERRLPYGIIAHDVEVYRYPGYKINDRIIRGRMLYGAAWIVANSRHTRSLLGMWGIADQRTLIVHPALSEQIIRESAKSYPLRENSDYILVTLCRLVRSKGIDIVLRALKTLEERMIPYRYLIGGEGEERGHLERLAGELGVAGRVQFLGYISDEQKASLFRRADIYVMPSRVDPKLHHEGFGLAFIEAAAFGVPGIGSRSGGIPDAVAHGETGLLVPQESAQELARALIFLYQDPSKRREMGRAAMERARNEFSPAVIAAKFQKEVNERIQRDCREG